MNLPRATGDGHRAVARVLWRKASQLPREQRVKVLHYAQLHAYLARAIDADPEPDRRYEVPNVGGA
jgi:phytoene/squalene synthetase